MSEYGALIIITIVGAWTLLNLFKVIRLHDQAIGEINERTERLHELISEWSDQE